MGMRAFSASSTMTNATAAKYDTGIDHRRVRSVTFDQARQRRLPKSRNALKKHHQQRWLSKEANHHFAARAKRSECGADSIAARSQKYARRGKEPDQRNGIGRAGEG